MNKAELVESVSHQLGFTKTRVEETLNAALKLIQDFVASVPYQGFQIVDPLIAKPVFEEGRAMFAKVEVGKDAQIQKGDPVQWIRLSGSTSKRNSSCPSTKRATASSRKLGTQRPLSKTTLP